MPTENDTASGHEITIDDDPDGLVRVHISGRLDQSSGRALHGAIFDAMDERRPLILDLAGVQSATGDCLNIVIGTQIRARVEDIAFAICAGSELRRSLQDLDGGSELAIFDDVPSARRFLMLGH